MSQLTNRNALWTGRKKKIALVTTALLAVSGGVAVAYWTVGGAGTGTATTGTTTDITVNQVAVVTDMFPGDEPQTLYGDFTNGNDGPVYVGTVTAAIVDVIDSEGATIDGCDASDYTLADEVMTVGEEVPVGDGGAWEGATIQFNDKVDANQNACKGATVNLEYTIGD